MDQNVQNTSCNAAHVRFRRVGGWDVVVRRRSISGALSCLFPTHQVASRRRAPDNVRDRHHVGGVDHNGFLLIPHHHVVVVEIHKENTVPRQSGQRPSVHQPPHKRHYDNKVETIEETQFYCISARSQTLLFDVWMT